MRDLFSPTAWKKKKKKSIPVLKWCTGLSLKGPAKYNATVWKCPESNNNYITNSKQQTKLEAGRRISSSGVQGVLKDTAPDVRWDISETIGTEVKPCPSPHCSLVANKDKASGSRSSPADRQHRPTEESSRPTEESSRPTEESSRPTAETSRQAAETSRPTEESSRPTAETSRMTEETSRQQRPADKQQRPADRRRMLLSYPPLCLFVPPGLE